MADTHEAALAYTSHGDETVSPADHRSDVLGSCLASDLDPGLDESAPRRPRWSEVSSEKEILEILDAPLHLGETCEAGFRRKERELLTAFSQLDPTESRTLHRRLSSSAAADDPIASRFGRLIAERQNRLRAYLADARRRAAIRRCR